MNKKLLFILTGGILTLALLVFFAVAGWDYFTQKEEGKCDDGVCGPVEKDKGICLEDCEKEGNGGAVSAETINFHQLATGKNFGDILKLFNPVIDEVNRRLYVVGSRTTYVGVVDLNKDELVDVFDIGFLGGFLVASNQKLYSFDFGGNKCYEIDTVNKKTSEISINTCTTIVPQDRGKPKQWGNYSFKIIGYQSFPDGKSGFPVDWRQDLNASYGIINIYDSSNNKKGEVVVGPDALYFAIDQGTGKLYTTNTGDSSISIFDLNKLESTNYCQNNSCWIKDIDVGNSADEVLADSQGNIYVRNRLGGSVIYKYNQNSKKFMVIDNENHVSQGKAMFNNNHFYDGIAMWPTDMELSKDEKRLYILSHYGALIDVIDTTTNKVSSRIQFTTSLKPRTDSISAMAVDKSRDRIFAAFPELGLIGVADGKNNKVLGGIDLTKYGFDKAKAANAGPGFINLAVNEKTNKLYVHLYNEKKLLVFNGDTLTKENEASLTLSKKRELSLTSNDEKGVIYLGNKIYNASTLQETGSFSRGQTVVAFNNENNSVYLTEMGQGSKPSTAQEKIYEFSGNSQTKEWTLDDIGSIPSRFYFDFGKNIFYVAYFESARVKKCDLASDSAPSASSTNNGATPNSTDCDKNKDGKVDNVEQQMCGKVPGETKPPINGTTQGKCGDGVCDAVEKANPNACPKDCK